MASNSSNRLKATLQRIRQDQPILENQIAVLVTVAITKKRFRRERQKPPAFLQSFFPYREFVYLQTKQLPTWEEYRKFVVAPLVPYLENIAKSSEAQLYLDVGFKDFKSILFNPAFRLILLIAHQVEKEEPLIEFADGAVPFKEIQNLLTTLDRPDPLSLLFLVCDSGTAALTLFDQIDINQLQAVGYTTWKIPLTGGLNFSCSLVEAFKKTTFLHQAFRQAITEIFGNNE